MICKRLIRIAAVVTLPLGGTALTVPQIAYAQSAPTVRQTDDLSTGWRFRFGGAVDGVTSPDYTDDAWQQVSLPHSWNRLGAYQLTRPVGNNAEQGIGWYRLTLTAPLRKAGERQFLQFDGVGAIATLWVNGKRVGAHKGAFSRFRFDVTDQLRSGARNVIVVSADNSQPAPGSTTADVLPLSGDFFIHGGLYRGVSLVTVSDAQIDMLDHGGPGIYLRTNAITPQAANVDLLARLRNLGSRARKLTLVTTISDASGRSVASDSAPVTLKPAAPLEVRWTVSLPDPHLWQGREDPYLYSVAVELREGIRVIDRVVQPLGVRSFAFDPDRGFILNGKPTRLLGASRHQDVAGKGWAAGPDEAAQDMALMIEMGLNAVRHAHYQHSQQWADEADKAGMAVWAEVPFVHESSLTNEAPTPALIDNAKEQLVELIRQNYNHPAIMIWSVGNEIDIGPAIAAKTGKGDGKPAQSLGLLQTLNTLAKQEDGSRPTAYADCCEGTPLQLKGAQVLTDTTDITAINRYFGWYYGAPEMVGKVLDGFHTRHPGKPIILSEYGAGGALTQHTDNPEGGPAYAYSRPHPEEYQSFVHEGAWRVLKSRDYLAGAFIWTMFDFASTMREEGEGIDLNDKGLVTYDRKARKDAFYFYKANLSAEPVVHVTGRRYVDRAYPVTDVRVYSNAPRASLKLNGKPLGEAPCPDRICVWHDVALAPGSNNVTVSADFKGTVHSDSLIWTAPDAAKGLNILAGTLTGATTSDGLRFGSDNFFTGGVGQSLISPIPGPKPKIAVATDRDSKLYGAYREGSFRYDLPLPNGQWTVTLHMFEPDAAKAADRNFDVTANGRRMLAGFNTAKAAGGILKGVTRQFMAKITNGGLVLDFQAAKGGSAIVSAISVTPAVTRHRKRYGMFEGAMRMSDPIA